MATMGRPRAFDRHAAVTQAMHLFWEHGFDATSLAQLKDSLGGGISAPSFYAAFGSKEGLFQEAVAQYLATHGQVTACLHDAALAPRDAIETALRRSAAMQCGPDHPRGCMVSLGVMSAPSPANAAVAQPLHDSRAETSAGLLACVRRGVASGQLAADTDTQALAMVFDGFLTGVSTLARDGVDADRLDAAVTQVMRLWDAARPASGSRA
ncbi:TetR/AcrR family transcriptional regulator [Xylophilus sp. GOD-11R]|uniref:TetR/AcrR family transcriptional regulator n=1 Tax=Xylophilus sp. GOD-11R TaxID=3089814 RepID=UPI00298D248E|nr:TetR/AcrR family transcriptional regulator [Xylophilus sp. GOD-11R]WPB58270.1 TetR/AcrR family transcriptional regulator [Xylophilus sp. GOD-11R]